MEMPGEEKAMTKLGDKLIGERLRSARELLGLKLNEVAERMGFNHYQTLSYIEKGTRPIKVSELTKLSKIYSRDYTYFLTESEPPAPEVGLIWRRDASKPVSKEVHAQIKHTLENYDLLESLTSEAKPPGLIPWEYKENGFNYNDVRGRAERLTRELGLGYRPGVNLASVLSEKHNLKIVFLEMGEEGSGATAHGDLGLAFIVNANDAPWRRNFDLAHELFHYLSMKTYPIEELPEYDLSAQDLPEKLANAFASALLLPRESITSEINNKVKGKRITLIDLIGIAQEFAVSTEALLWRMVSLNIIKKEDVEQLMSLPEFSALDKEQRRGKNEPAPQFSQRFVALGLKAMEQGKISKGKFCEIFGITISGFASFIAARGFSEGIMHKQALEITDS